MFTTIAFIIGVVCGWFLCQKLEDITSFATKIISKFRK
jgi:hypothetical protein